MSTNPNSSPNLPVELVEQILGWVETPYRELELLNKEIKRPNTYRNPSNPWLVSRRALRNACLVSRVYNLVARKLLYRNVMLLHATDIVLLFRTLLEEGGTNHQSPRDPGGLRSNIVNLVCLVTLFDESAIKDTARAWSDVPFPRHIEPSDMTALYLSNLDPGRVLYEETPGFQTTLQRLFGVLLGFTAQLKSITLQCPSDLADSEGYSSLDRVIRSLRQIAEPGNEVLSCLTTLAVQPAALSHATSERMRRGPNLFVGFLELPTLQTLYARTSIGPLDVDDFAGGLALEHVTLHGSSSLADDIESYAELCPNLRRLEIFCLPSDMRTMDTALSHVADRLKSLALRLVPYTPSEFLDNDHVPSLHDTLTCLTDLIIEDRLLFRNVAEMERVGLAQRLPPSLVSLVLVEQWGASGRHMDGAASTQVDAMFRALNYASSQFPEALPALRSFVFDRSQHWLWQGHPADAAFRSQYPALKDAFSPTNIKFVILDSRSHSFAPSERGPA